MRTVLTTLLVLTCAAPAGAAEVTRLPNGNVNVSARGTPLGAMLRQFGAIAPLDTSLVDPKALQGQVDLALQDVPFSAALAASFEAAGASYAVWGSDPSSLRIVAFAGGAQPLGETREHQTAKAYVAPPLPTEGYVLPNGIVLPPGISPDDPDVAMIGGPAAPYEGRPEDDPELAEALAIDPSAQISYSPEDAEKKP